MIKAILFDFTGTTVREADPAVICVFEKAFADNNISVDISLLKKPGAKTKNYY